MTREEIAEAIAYQVGSVEFTLSTREERTATRGSSFRVFWASRSITMGTYGVVRPLRKCLDKLVENDSPF